MAGGRLAAHPEVSGQVKTCVSESPGSTAHVGFEEITSLLKADSRQKIEQGLVLIVRVLVLSSIKSLQQSAKPHTQPIQYEYVISTPRIS